MGSIDFVIGVLLSGEGEGDGGQISSHMVSINFAIWVHFDDSGSGDDERGQQGPGCLLRRSLMRESAVRMTRE